MKYDNSESYTIYGGAPENVKQLERYLSGEEERVTEPNIKYRGKQFTVPEFSKECSYFNGFWKRNNITLPDKENPIIQSLNSVFDLSQFNIARKPISLGIHKEYQDILGVDHGVPRTLDMPIKFPGSEFRLPKELAIYEPILQNIADYEISINRHSYEEYYCYLTIDSGYVEPGLLQREAPCHVDGFQGRRIQPKVRNNHTYTVSNTLPTAYYIQPFDFSKLDDSKHDFFWEMNRQVAATKEAYKWQPQDNELTLMDCYCVHRGVPADMHCFRTFLRASFEVRIFDRLGNAHNPAFAYNWNMVARDIEELGLQPFDLNCDPSLRVFPWQNTNGNPNEKGVKTQPKLK